MFSKYVLLKKGHLNKRAGVWTPWTPPPWIRHWSATALFVVLAAQHGDVVGNGDHSAVRCQDRLSRLGHHESGLQHGALHLRTDHADAGCRRLTVYAHRV